MELLATLSILLSIAQADVPVILDQNQPFEAVVNRACAGLPVGTALRQRLLDEDDLMERHRMLSDHLDAVIESVAQLRNSGQGGSSKPN
jgi:hypothetical protein